MAIATENTARTVGKSIFAVGATGLIECFDPSADYLQTFVLSPRMKNQFTIIVRGGAALYVAAPYLTPLSTSARTYLKSLFART